MQFAYENQKVAPQTPNHLFLFAVRDFSQSMKLCYSAREIVIHSRHATPSEYRA